MTNAPPNAVVERLQRHGQEHVLQWWDALHDGERETLLAQIDAVDFEVLERLRAHAEDGGETPAQKALRATPPRELVRQPQTDEERAEFARARRRGEELLAAGKVAAILVAGGQGTRLGFDHPKGMYPVGPMSGATLFEVLAHQLRARARRSGVTIPYFVMTSDATHEETVAFFDQHSCFGLDRDDVRFFRQGNMPAVDDTTGKLLLAEKGRLATSPDGHGGILDALRNAGLLQLARDRGIELLYYHQVDNPTAIVCDPVFLGFHALRGSEMSTKVARKRAWDERMGVVVDVDGVTQIIEYSDLPDEVAQRTDADGQLEIWAGSTAIHVFDRTFLERLVGDESLALPFHVAHKKVPCVNDAGDPVVPEEPNAHKFEKFVFDAMPHAETALVLEANRVDEFNPVKNRFGNDSPATSLVASTALFRRWLTAAGASVPDYVPIEIDPLFALDADELKTKIAPGTTFDGPVLLEDE